MPEKDKDWETYLLSPSGVSSDAIGVVNLDNDEEIDKKLDAVERNDFKYKEPVKSISKVWYKKEEIIDWLLSLGD